MKILIVDDNAARHQILKRHMKDHMVYSAFDFKSFQELMDSNRFDAAFLDHDLGDPDGDGRTVAMELAKMSTDVQPRRIVIQSWNFKGARDMENILRDAGYSFIVVSPFDPDGVGHMMEIVQDV